MEKEYFVILLGFSLLFSVVPMTTLAQPVSSEHIALEFLTGEYGQIDIINQQSYPIQDGPWVTEFVTKGTHDLIISAIDGTSFWGFNSDVSFVELYDGDIKLVPLIKNNKIIFPNFSSDKTNHLKMMVNSLGEHHLKFEFGSDVTYADNFASSNSNTLIASGTNGGPTLTDSDFFGIDVTNMGDINNDGVDDLAVGAYLDDTGGDGRGAVYILFMNTDGTVKTSPAPVKIADSTNGGPSLTNVDRFGRSVANIGDVNNDGTNDLAVGVTQDNTGGTDRGVVYILFLNTSGTAGAATTVKLGSSTNGVQVLLDDGRFGEDVANIGDLDNDGIDDLLVGAFKDDTGGNDRGAVYVVFMNTDGTASSSNKIASGVDNGPTLDDTDYFGRSVAGIGDLNNDGIEDIAVGAQGDDTGGTDRGAVYILFMNTDGTAKSSPAPVQIASGINGGPTLTDGDSFGYSIANMGDLNGDGVIDLAVNAFSDDTGGSATGAVYILFMKTDGGVDSFVKIADNTNGGPSLDASDRFGIGLANMGDLNNDGVTDLAAGAFGDDTGNTDRGGVYIINLKTISPDGNGSVSSSAEINDSTTNGPTLTDDDRFGTSVANIGDLNNDGVDDIVVGARADDNGGTDRGAIHIMFLNTDGSVDSTVEINDATTNGPVLSDGDRFGISVANIGDLNNDGVNDIAAGALDDNGGTDRGAIHIMFMTTAGAMASATVEINSASSPGPSIIDGDFFGASIANIGDLNNDGVDDLAVGARDDDDGGSGRGAVHILYMNTDGSIDSTVEINSATSNGPVLSDADGLGNAIANIGDLNNDGVNDIAVAANKDDAGGDLRGTIHIMFMNTNGSIDSTVEINSSTSNGPTLSDGDRFGASIVNMGDLNGDGVTDIAVGANSDDGTSTDRGAIHIMFLNTDGSVDSTVEINDVTTNGPTLVDSDLFAGSISNMGDLNNDGVTDILSAAERDDNGGTDKGAAHILFMDKTTIVTNVNSTTTDGTYSTIGNVIDVVATFSETVTVTGTPQLTLETGTTDRVLDYATGSGTDKLTFQYTVQSGDSSSDLDYVATSSLSSGTSVTASTSPNSNAVLTLPTPGELGSIGFNQALVISSPTSPSAGDFLQSITNADGDGGAFTSGVLYNIATNSTNHIFAALSTDDKISKFTSSGIFLSDLTTSINNPHAVTIDSNDRIIVAQDGGGGNNIRIYDATGTLVNTLTGGETGATAFSFPHDVDTDSSNNIYMVDRDANVAQKYNSAGVHQLTLTGGETGATAFSEPLGVAVDSTGRIIVLQRGGTTDGFQIFDSSGNFVKRVTDADGAGGTFSDPHDVEVDSFDRIYVADQGNNRIQIFDSTGTFLQSITTASPVSPTAFNGPEGVEIDGNGRILVADTTNNRIQIFQKLDDPDTTTTTTTAASVSSSDKSDSTQYQAEVESATPDETFSLPEEEYDEVVSESLATPIVETVEVPVVETFEAVSAPEKVKTVVEDTSFKVLTKKLSKSDDKEDDAKKLGLEYKDGDVRALVILDDTSDAVINEI